MITIKNVKYAEFQSHETHCFQATIYFNDARVAIASNEGQGGPTDFDWLVPEKQEAVEEFISTLAPMTFEMRGRTERMAHNLESHVSELVTQWLLERDYKRAISRRFLYTLPEKPDALYQTKPLRKQEITAWLNRPQDLMAKLGADKLLNLLPFDEGYKLYLELACE